ncbi:hypothetical protein QLG10_25685 [Pseudomonas sp. V98_8]|uniref:hypothetical protein n=1 Tax=Pseudomonas sp. V98_8 TaxID=3044228 RepID=UPI00249E23A8|nr:hypothetical protein [Pseudomonas sp. V98_8]MDI3395830.1 hypothetical protein [Pseudomonas sp. V98_8]
MTIQTLALLAAMVYLPAQAASEVAPRVEHVVFKNGADSATFSDSIKGRLTAEYRLRAKAGQMLTVDLKPSNASAYFNITAKGEEYALFNGSIMGNHFLGPLPADGQYVVQVYLMRNAARRNEVANYSLSLNLGAPDASNGSRPFDQTLELQGIVFHVTDESIDGSRAVRIAPPRAENR